MPSFAMVPEGTGRKAFAPCPGFDFGIAPDGGRWHGESPPLDSSALPMPDPIGAMPAHAPISLHRSALVRCLVDQGIGPTAEPALMVAERLGQWLDWTDAQALFTELQRAPAGQASAGGATTTPKARAALEEFQRARGDLTRAITDPVFTDATADAAAFRRHHHAHQQTMETRLGALRAQVRAALTAASPALARLAALDALMAQALAARERQLLAAVPALMARRAARTRLAGNDIPVVDKATVKAALLDELALRLQPIEGLLEALGDLPAPPSAVQAGQP